VASRRWSLPCPACLAWALDSPALQGRALKPGGVLSVTELLGDPHYQFKSTLKRLAAQAGFQLQSIQGGLWLYTANFVKPGAALAGAALFVVADN
jgi:hypothetical protein